MWKFYRKKTRRRRKKSSWMWFSFVFFFFSLSFSPFVCCFQMLLIHSVVKFLIVRFDNKTMKLMLIPLMSSTFSSSACKYMIISKYIISHFHVRSTLRTLSWHCICTRVCVSLCKCAKIASKWRHECVYSLHCAWMCVCVLRCSFVLILLFSLFRFSFS